MGEKMRIKESMFIGSLAFVIMLPLFLIGYHYISKIGYSFPSFFEIFSFLVFSILCVYWVMWYKNKNRLSQSDIFLVGILRYSIIFISFGVASYIGKIEFDYPTLIYEFPVMIFSYFLAYKISNQHKGDRNFFTTIVVGISLGISWVLHGKMNG